MKSENYTSTAPSCLRNVLVPNAPKISVLAPENNRISALSQLPSTVISIPMFQLQRGCAVVQTRLPLLYRHADESRRTCFEEYTLTHALHEHTKANGMLRPPKCLLGSLIHILQSGSDIANIESGLQDCNRRRKKVLSSLGRDEVVNWINIDRLGSNLKRTWRICCLALADGDIETSILRRKVSLIGPGRLDEPVPIFDS